MANQNSGRNRKRPNLYAMELVDLHESKEHYSRSKCIVSSQCTAIEPKGILEEAINGQI